MLRLSRCWHSLESPVGVLHDNCTGMAQDKAWNPALGCRALVSGGSEHQKHVLLVTGQNLNDLSLIDVYLILLHCRVLVCHQHGGDVATAAAFTLQGRGRKEGGQGLRRGPTAAAAGDSAPWHQARRGLGRQTGRSQTPPSHTLQLNAPLQQTWSAMEKQLQKIHLSADALGARCSWMFTMPCTSRSVLLPTTCWASQIQTSINFEGCRVAAWLTDRS